MGDTKGDVQSFDANWRAREETAYLHWTRGEPENQIQLAFRQHWLTFNQLLANQVGSKRCLEVGCGRGSLSAYFSDAGWKCTLLDLSPTAIERAVAAFHENGLIGKFDVGDCLSLPYNDGSFDLVFSIGTLEHFSDVNNPIQEQVRVLDSGGMFINYIVPENPRCLQKNFEWINDLLRVIYAENSVNATTGKSDVYRSDANSSIYLTAMQNAGLVNCGSDGAYPLPMISYSPDFPFTLLPPAVEKSLVSTFQHWLSERKSSPRDNPWLCPEGEGQAFLVWGRKP